MDQTTRLCCEIANLTAERTFGLLDTGKVYKGPGASLFARWADEFPEEEHNEDPIFSDDESHHDEK